MIHKPEPKQSKRRSCSLLWLGFAALFVLHIAPYGAKTNLEMVGSAIFQKVRFSEMMFELMLNKASTCPVLHIFFGLFGTLIFPSRFVIPRPVYLVRREQELAGINNYHVKYLRAQILMALGEICDDKDRTQTLIWNTQTKNHMCYVVAGFPYHVDIQVVYKWLWWTWCIPYMYYMLNNTGQMLVVGCSCFNEPRLLKTLLLTG